MKRGLALLIFAVMFCMTHATYAATFCVSTTDELQIAMTTAASNGEDDDVQIVQGTYMGNFVFTSAEEFDLTIEGGYTAGCTSRVIEPANTIIDANSTDSVFVLIGNTAVDFVIDGLTVQNGNTTSNGGGLYIKTAEGEVILSNNIVSGNKAKDNGGGVYIEGTATATLTDNFISGNTVISDMTATGGPMPIGNGGGVYFAPSSTVTLTDNAITGNTANYFFSNGGGGLYFGSSSTVTLTNNIISNNIADNDVGGEGGGGVYFGSSSSVTLTSNVISGNMADGGFILDTFWFFKHRNSH
ncbi:MAG: right-handed parallel beta-helix repeat-containing protein [Pseudomonadota bacterium]